MTIRINRRHALMGASGLTVAAAVGCGRADMAPPPAPTGPFRHGVASGDADQTSVVLWTAITDDAGGYRGVELAADADFSEIVFSEGEDRRYIQPSPLTTVKYLATGLEPGRTYHYRFRFGDARSPAGVTRTLPEGVLDAFRIAVVSCSNHPAGYFNAYRDIANRDDVDLVLHLGDYIYEYGMGGYATDDAEGMGRIPDPLHEILTYEDYARRHAQYKSDPDLQAAHAAAPWMMVWDDHEVANDAWTDGAENHQPDEGDWSERRAAGLRAYNDWTPTREPDPKSARWRACEIGDLATLILLETRHTARTEPVEWDQFPAIPDDAPADDPEALAQVRRFREDVLGDPDRMLLGAEQLAYVTEALSASTAAGKPWQILGNQTLIGRIDMPDYNRALPFWLRWYVKARSAFLWEYVRRSRFGVPLNLDAWDGYTAERERLLGAARAADANLVALTGDSHNFWVNRLTTDSGELAGIELGTSSVSSPGPFEILSTPGTDLGQVSQRENPDVLRHNAYDRGYIHLTLTPGEARADYVRIDTVKRRAYTASLDSCWRLTPRTGGAPDIEPV